MLVESASAIFDTLRQKADGKEFQIFFRSLPRPCDVYMGGSLRRGGDMGGKWPGGLQYFRFYPLRGPKIALRGDFGPWSFVQPTVAWQNSISPPPAESRSYSAIQGATLRVQPGLRAIFELWVFAKQKPRDPSQPASCRSGLRRQVVTVIPMPRQKSLFLINAGGTSTSQKRRPLPFQRINGADVNGTYGDQRGPRVCR
jgi:hypothetical protein